MTPPTAADPPSAQALVRTAAVELIREKGLGSFSVREVARRAGVSHATPGYFFGGTEGLLTSLAVEGFEALYREMEDVAAASGDPIERLRAIGRAYVKVATRFPAHFEVIFREDVVDTDDGAYASAGLRAYAVLSDAIAGVAAAHNPTLDVDDGARLCWSAMQGLVTLTPKLARMDALTGAVSATTEELVDRFTALLVSGLIHPPVR